MNNVAILILLELTLQSEDAIYDENYKVCRNPYFIGINSAIDEELDDMEEYLCRNPYFIGINSAIKNN